MFFRVVFLLLLAIVLLTAIRMFAGVLSKGVGGLFEPHRPSGPRPPSGPSGGKLERDPVCGAYVPAATALQARFKDGTHFFCSPACRDKYRPN